MAESGKRSGLLEGAAVDLYGQGGEGNDGGHVVVLDRWPVANAIETTESRSREAANERLTPELSGLQALEAGKVAEEPPAGKPKTPPEQRRLTKILASDPPR